MNSTVPTWLQKLAWIGVAIWALTICVLSSMTPPQLEKIAPFQLWDKAEHFIAFACGAISLTLALRWTKTWTNWQIWLVAAVALSVFGALDEIHQLFTPHRSGADVHDWLADTIGASVGSLFTLLIYARFSRSPGAAPRGA